MKFKATILSAVFISVSCLASTAIAGDRHEFSPAEDQALVLQEFDRFYVDAPLAADFAVMNVRVFDADNQMVLQVRSTGQPVEMLIDSGLPDGKYRYEIVSIFAMADPNDRAAMAAAEKTLYRNFGSFKVFNG
jgi:hypothetical protein